MAVLETDPIDIALTADGELDLTTGTLQLTAGLEGVRQALKTALGQIKGEWFLNLDSGVPLYTDVLGQKYDEVVVLRAFRDTILNVVGVTELAFISSDFDSVTREVTITFKTLTVFGDTVADSITFG